MNETEDAPRDIAPLTASRVVGTICSYCLLSPPFTGTDKLLRCTTCKRAAYCGLTCQKADWKIAHKRLCKKFVQINEFDKTLQGKGKLSRFEYVMWDSRRLELFTEPTQNQPYGSTYSGRYIHEQLKCSVCFRTPFVSAEYYPLTICSRCTLAWHCPSDECVKEFKRTHVRSECDILAECASVERLTIDYALSRGDRRQLMIFSPEPARSYFPLSAVKNWEQYCRIHLTNFDPIISDIATDSPELFTMSPMTGTAATMMIKEAASLSLTMVAGLEKSIMDLPSRRELRVHIVGSEQREAMGKGTLEEVLHLLPACLSLTVCFIGPQTWVPDDEELNVACDHCQNLGTRRTNAYYPGRYHDYVESHEGRKPADFIICYNTGMSEMEEKSWAKTLRVILDSNIPAAFTGYSRVEIMMEKALLEKSNAKFVLQPEQNPWKGVIPIRSVTILPKAETTKESEMWSYVNYWWYIIQGCK